MIDLPVMVKQDPQEIKLIPQSPMKSVPQSPLKLVPQSPLRFTNVSETSDTKQLNR